MSLREMNLVATVMLLCLASCTSGQRFLSSLSSLGAGTNEATQELVRVLQPDNIPRFVGCLLREAGYEGCDKRGDAIRVLITVLDSQDFACSNCSNSTIDQMCLIKNSLVVIPEQCRKLKEGLKLINDICVPGMGCENVPPAGQRTLQGN
ncbi:uncharacterized protein [Procambarus clarkii]|uniref:uncharacterized protein n=1 Tax=Procambarus clarkii TaxID=6728 RepID=UPI0037421650